MWICHRSSALPKRVSEGPASTSKTDLEPHSVSLDIEIDIKKQIILNSKQPSKKVFRTIQSSCFLTPWFVIVNKNVNSRNKSQETCSSNFWFELAFVGGSSGSKLLFLWQSLALTPKHNLLSLRPLWCGHIALVFSKLPVSTSLLLHSEWPVFESSTKIGVFTNSSSKFNICKTAHQVELKYYQ